MHTNISLKSNKCYFGRIRGGFQNVLNILIKKQEDNGIKIKDVLGVMHCYDGANHLVREYGCISVISFNCQVFSRDIVDASSSTCSRNILTWQQATVKETWENLKDLIESHYNERI